MSRRGAEVAGTRDVSIGIGNSSGSCFLVRYDVKLNPDQPLEIMENEMPLTRSHRNRTTTTRRGVRLVAALFLFFLFTSGPAAVQQEANEYEAPAVPLSAFSARPANFSQEVIDITLEPGEGMEYKYRLEPGGTLLFSWTSDALVHYELHSQPDGAPQGFAESYDKQGLPG